MWDNQCTIGALRGFLRDHKNGEFEWNEVVNVFGPNDANFLLRQHETLERVEKILIDAAVSGTATKREAEIYRIVLDGLAGKRSVSTQNQ